MATTYPVQTEQKRWHQCVQHEYDSIFTRDTITIASGENDEHEPIKPLTVLGKATAATEYGIYADADNDVAILYTDTGVDTFASSQQAVAMVRGIAVVKFSELLGVDSLTAAQQTSLKAKLLSQNIKAV